MKRRLAILAVPVILLAACGGDDDSSDGDTAATADDVGETDASGDTDGGDDESAGDGSSADDWCSFARSVDEIDAELDELDPFDAESVEAAYSQFRDAIGSARDQAPDEIDDAIDTLYDGIVRIDDELAAVDYNFLDLDMAFMTELEADLDAASEQVEAYNESECGIPADDDDSTTEEDAATDDESSDDDFDPAAGTVRDQLIQSFVAGGFSEDEAGCIADNIDIAGFTESGGDTAEILEVFETCDIDLERLAELGGG